MRARSRPPWPRRAPARKLVRAAAPLRSQSADHELGISWYLPDELILNRKNLPLIRSPWESNWIGWPRIEVGSFVFLIAARTLLRLGVWPALHTEAIASSITCVAANTGGPNVPNDPYLAFAAAAGEGSGGIGVGGGQKDET